MYMCTHMRMKACNKQDSKSNIADNPSGTLSSTLCFLISFWKEGAARPPELPLTSHCDVLVAEISLSCSARVMGLSLSPAGRLGQRQLLSVAWGGPCSWLALSPWGTHSCLWPVGPIQHLTSFFWLHTDEGFSPGPEQ